MSFLAKRVCLPNVFGRRGACAHQPFYGPFTVSQSRLTSTVLAQMPGPGKLLIYINVTKHFVRIIKMWSMEEREAIIDRFAW